MLDFSDPRFIADPYPVYRRLRERAPVWRSPPGERVLTRHADIVAVLRSPQFGHDFEERLARLDKRPKILDEPAWRAMALSMLVRDPPDHTRLRGLVAKAFTARRIEAHVATLLDAIVPRGRMDVMADFAHPLPILVICDLLGIAEEDRLLLLSVYRFTGRMLDPNAKTAAEVAAENANTLRIRACFEEIFRRRAREPDDGLISTLLKACGRANGGLSRDELAVNVALMLDAGHATSSYMIGNAVLALARHPAQWELLKARPQLAAGAVDELLRFDSPVQLTSRRAFADAHLPGGEVIRRGERVICALGAGNRDPQAHRDPDRLDITRTDARPLSFGGGIHHCLGAALARLEGEVVLRRLAERLPGLTLEDAEHPQWRRTVTLRGLARLPARW